MTQDAVVLLSGGLDSATALAHATAGGFRCHTVTFDYGQRHQAELAAAARIANELKAASQRVVRIDLGGIRSALTDTKIDVPEYGGTGIPATYVPARNTIFLACALGIAESIGARDIVIGVNAVDYSGYPDCRPEFVTAFEHLANLATKAGIEGDRFKIHAPLIDLTKADIIRTGTRLGIDYAHTVSCYKADSDGRACGACDSCRIRKAGFEHAGIPDPTRYRG